MYFDPGIGSLIIQTIVAAIAVLGVFFATAKLRVKGLFQKNKKQTSDDASKDDEL